MKGLTEKLQMIGLTEKESSLYLAGLLSGPVSAAQLAKLSDIKRSSIYHLVDGLVEKGAAIVRNSFEGRRIVMSAPHELSHVIDTQRRALDEREKLLEALLPDLQGVAASDTKERVDVRQFDGIEGVKLALDEALHCKSRTWDIIAPKVNFLEDFDLSYKEYYVQTRKEREIKNRTLWEERELDEAEQNKDFAWRNPRILPEVMNGKFASIMILFDGKILLLSSYKNLSATIITSKEHHDLFTAVFDGLWVQAEPLKEFLRK